MYADERDSRGEERRSGAVSSGDVTQTPVRSASYTLSYFMVLSWLLSPSPGRTGRTWG
jgi:hypothetical protein